MITYLISSKLFSFTPLKPFLISSIVKVPSPSLSNYLNNFPKSKISFSLNYEAMKVKVTFFNLSCEVKFFNALKLSKSFLPLPTSECIHLCYKTYEGVGLFSGFVSIVFIRSFALSETLSNSSISKENSPFYTYYKIS